MERGRVSFGGVPGHVQGRRGRVVPGNPMAAGSLSVGGAVAYAPKLIDFGFLNRVTGLGVSRSATETDAAGASRFYLDLGLTQSVVQVAPDVI